MITLIQYLTRPKDLEIEYDGKIWRHLAFCAAIDGFILGVNTVLIIS